MRTVSSYCAETLKYLFLFSHLVKTHYVEKQCLWRLFPLPQTELALDDEGDKTSVAFTPNKEIFCVLYVIRSMHKQIYIPFVCHKGIHRQKKGLFVILHGDFTYVWSQLVPREV